MEASENQNQAANQHIRTRAAAEPKNKEKQQQKTEQQKKTEKQNQKQGVLATRSRTNKENLTRSTCNRVKYSSEFRVQRSHVS